ncbi:MAG: MFS transporter [Chloroflexi bacterium]|nr:MFS transporter [Chloroflexota bacterium]
MTTASVQPQPSPLAIFRNRNFTFLWLGQLVSTIGSSLATLAASILVFRLTGSALSVGLMLMATAAPSLVVGLIAGVFVDRFDRKRIMIAADLLRGGLVVLIPILIPYNIVWLYVIIMLTSAIGQFFEPAHASVLPEIASDEELAAANSFIAISSFGSTAIGFAASGLIAAQFGIEWAFYLDGLSFVLSALFIYLVRIQPTVAKGRATVKTVVRNLRSGLSFLFENPILKSLYLVSLPVFLSFGLWNSLLLPFAIRALQASEFEYGVQEGLTSVGFVVGSLIMARWSERLREGQWISISFLIMGVVGAIYSQTASISMAIVLVTISGFANAPSAISRRLVIQRNVPRDKRGRINSAFFVTRDVVFLIGMAAAGLADVIDIRVLIFGSSILLLGSGLVSLKLPGLGQPAAEWRRALRLLKAAPATPSISLLRTATPADFDRLAGHLPLLSSIGVEERDEFTGDAEIIEVAIGKTILHHGESGDDVYFILSGRAVAGLVTKDNDYRSLSTMSEGDFFGEIAALAGSKRTADVVAVEKTTLWKISAANLKILIKDPQLKKLFHSKMHERLNRTQVADLPRLAGVDQEFLADLRTPRLKAETPKNVQPSSETLDQGDPE